MSKVKYFKKNAVQPMEAWEEGYDMKGVSVSEADAAAGSPKEGDFIASNPKNPDDKWLVAADFLKENYEDVTPPDYSVGNALLLEKLGHKSLGNTPVNSAKKNVKDMVVFGDGDTFKLICKASSQNEGCMKSTKAMQIDGAGCVVQVTTQQRNPDGSYAVAEALSFVPGVKIQTHCLSDDIVGRAIVEATPEAPDLIQLG